ncbi:MAG: hypothetical protein JNK72_00265 [Myxococcales bacterium]|nr:hypothetical protein [Myxococcales bacterium]
MNADAARDLRERLTDPRELCSALGLIEGPRGRHWTTQPGGGVMVRCPWHAERSPSCSVRRGDGGFVVAKCFACSASGDVLGLVAAVYGLDVERDYPEVLREAAHLAGFSLDDERPRVLPPRPPPPPEPEPLDDATFATLARYILAACPLQGEPDVARYLNSRRLGRLALAEGWGALPGDRVRLDQLTLDCIALVGRDAWRRSGLAVREGKHQDRMVWGQHRLIIPWRGPGLDGAVLTLQRRTLGPPPEGVGKYIFASGRPPRFPYGIDLFAEEEDHEAPVVWVEGAIDALALRALCRSRRVPAQVLGLPGISAWSRHGDLWAQYARRRRVALGLDLELRGQAAEAVDKALTRMGETLGAVATRIDRWRPVGHHDWAEVWAAERSKGQAA